MRRELGILFKRPSFHQPVVDGVRAIAILWVVLFHVLFFHLGTLTADVVGIFKAPLTIWISNGPLGVDLFFVISGYLIGTILLKELRQSGRIELRRFYGRRFLRLLPVYVVAMAMGVFLLRNIPKSSILMEFEPSGNLGNAWANLLYVNNFLPFQKQYMIWTWSLAIEEQFYLLAPLALLVLVGRFRRPLAWMFVLLVLSGVIRFVIIRWHGFVPPFTDSPADASWSWRLDLTYTKLHVRYGGLLAGLMGAYLSLYQHPRLTRFFASGTRSTLVVAVALIVLIWGATVSYGTSPLSLVPDWGRQVVLALHRDLFSIGAAVIILVAIHGRGSIAGGLQRTFAARWLYPISQISYSLYLVHELFMMWLFPRTTPWMSANWGLTPLTIIVLNGLLAVAVSVVVSIFLYVLVERPSMEQRNAAWFRRLVEPRGAAKEASSSSA